MVMTIALDIVAAAIIPVLITIVAMIATRDGAMIIGSILGADDCRRQSGHGNGREGN